VPPPLDAELIAPPEPADESEGTSLLEQILLQRKEAAATVPEPEPEPEPEGEDEMKAQEEEEAFFKHTPDLD